MDHTIFRLKNFKKLFSLRKIRIHRDNKLCDIIYPSLRILLKNSKSISKRKRKAIKKKKKKTDSSCRKISSYWISELKLSEIIRNQYLYSFSSFFFFFFLVGLITLNRLIFHKHDPRISIKLIR